MKYFAKMLIALIGSGMMMLIIYHMLARRYRRVCHRVPEAVKRDLKVSAYVKQVTDEQKEEIVRQQRKELLIKPGKMFFLFGILPWVCWTIIVHILVPEETVFWMASLLGISVAAFLIIGVFYLRDVVCLHRNYCICKGRVKKVMHFVARGKALKVARIYYYDPYKDTYYITALEVPEHCPLHGAYCEVDLMMWDTGKCYKPAMIVSKKQNVKEQGAAKKIRASFRLMNVQEAEKEKAEGLVSNKISVKVKKKV